MTATPCRLTPGDIQIYLADLVPLVYSTAEDYFDSLFGSRQAGRNQIETWCQRPDSEFYLGGAEAVIEHGHAAAVILALTGVDVMARRKADILALLKFLKHKGQSNLNDLRGTAPPVGKDQYYVRAIAVRDDCQRRGFAKVLLGRAVDQARSIEGIHELSLDVRASNQSALRLYSQLRFRPAAVWCAPPGNEMLRMVLPLI